MITILDMQAWESEIVTGNAQFIELGSTIYVVSQVRADNTFAIFKSLPTPPQPGPGAAFSITATYTFPTINGNNNTSFDPAIAYDSNSQNLFIVGTQDNVNGQDVDVLLFSYNTNTDTLDSPLTLVTASFIRDSYDVCPLTSSQFIGVAVTNPLIIWGTPTVASISGTSAITILNGVITVIADNGFSAGQQVTFSGVQNATQVNGFTVTVIGSTGSQFTASTTLDDYTQVAGTFESGFVTWLPGHSLIGIELNGDSLVGIQVIDSSPYRSGDTFGAVSVYSPDGASLEVYYECHPKVVTFSDQIFSINQALRTSEGTWSIPPTTLMTYTGRLADSRLTVVANGNTRVLLQQYYSQLVHQNALVGNLLLGYYDGVTQWNFHIQPGSTVTSYIQGTLSVSRTSTSTKETFVSYLAEPVYSLRGVWSPQVKIYNVNDRTSYEGVDYIVTQALTYNYIGNWVALTTYVSGAVVQVALPTNPISYGYYTAQVNVPDSYISPNLDTANWSATTPPLNDSRFIPAPTAWPLQTNYLNTSTFNLTNISGFYNNFNFSWLRGAKSVLDYQTQWAIVGERVGNTSGATYISAFDVPPNVVLVPDVTGGTVTVLRGTPFLFDASRSNDTNLDPLTFTWTLAPINTHVSLTPIAPSDATANLLVSRSIGGAAHNFVVGVIATTSLHEPMVIVSISIAGGTLTVDTDSAVNLAEGQTIFLYDIVTATFLNNVVVTVAEDASGNSFTAAYTHADYSSTDAGSAIASPQFDYCNVLVPYNAAPTITFPVNPISAARNSAVLIQPIYTGTTDADDATTYVWSQISGTGIPTSQITGGTNSSSLQFETNGVLIQGETLVWRLTVNDGVNAPVTATVDVVVSPYEFAFQDTHQLARSLWGGTGIALLQSKTYTGYGYQPPATGLSFDTPTQTGSLIIVFESDNKGNNLSKLFGSQAVTTANSGTNWDIDYIINSTSASSVTGFISDPGTDIAQTPDWVIAEFSNIFTVFDQSVVASEGAEAILTTTNQAGFPALVVATVKLNNDTGGALTGNPPLGWTTLLYNTTKLSSWPGAASAVFYQIINNPATTVSFQWPTHPTTIGGGNMITSLTSFNASASLTANISQRNTVQTWTPLDLSAIYTNFQNVKRSSVLDGTDRYLLISPASVCVYGGINPNMLLLRKLFVPSNDQILDAFHTEDDWTIVLDVAGNLYRFTDAPLINTDNADALIVLSSVSSMSINKVFATYSFNGSRVLILTGSDGCLLLEIGNTNFNIEGSVELNTETGLLYGVDNVQFVRTSNVESLSTGKILLGSIVPVVANITSIEILNNTVTVVAPNTFGATQVITFLNLTQATFLNGVTTSVISADPDQFIVSFENEDYTNTDEGVGAIATSGGKTYETLIDLSHGQIIGTWDASNLRNQYVTTGEILFELNDTYAGRPSAPIMNPVINQGGIISKPGMVNLVISWSSDRPDLVQFYQLGTSLDSVNWITTTINSGYIESVTLPEPAGQQLYFRVQSFSTDGTSVYSNIVSIHT